MYRRTLLAALLCSTLASAGPPAAKTRKPATGPERFFDVDSWVGTVSCELKLDYEGKMGVSVTEDRAPIMLKAHVRRRFMATARFDDLGITDENSKMWGATFEQVQGAVHESGSQTVKGELLMKGTVDATRVVKPDREKREDGTLGFDLSTKTFTVQINGVDVEGTAMNQFAGQKAAQTEPTTATLEFRDIRDQPLPAQGLRLAATVKSQEPIYSVNNPGLPGEWTCTVDVAPEGSTQLRAVIEPVSPVDRGQKAKLVGASSTPKGKIDAYEWTFESLDCHPSKLSSSAKLTGSTVSAVVLCPMTVKLTVKSGGREHSTTARVDVTPRKFDLPANYLVDEKAHDFPHPLGDIAVQKNAAGDLVGGWQGGENVCAKDSYSDAAHRLHPARDARGSWDKAGYVLEQVSDKGGPFDGMTWVKTSKLEVARRVLINKWILENAPNRLRAQKNFFQHNQQHGKPVAAYLAAVRAHEGLGNGADRGHSGRFQDAMKDSKLMEELEKTVTEKRPDAVSACDALVKKEETRLCEKIRDPLPVTWEGELLAPSPGPEVWHPLVTGVGDLKRGQRAPRQPPCQ